MYTAAIVVSAAAVQPSPSQLVTELSAAPSAAPSGHTASVTTKVS